MTSPLVPSRLGLEDYHPLEIASGFLRGQEQVEPLSADPALSMRAALEHAVLNALRRPPCVVSFSGGRDSSAVLAIATSVADREGLPRPLPVTLRFADDSASQETEWQETVVRHLHLADWQRIDLGTEIDVVGPYADTVLRRHGLLYPLNTHFHLPVLDHAREGSLLTGIGGDEVLSAARFRHLNAVLRRKERPRPRDLLSLVAAYGPRWIARAAVTRRDPYHLSWLTRSANRDLGRWRARSIAEQEVRWDRWITRSWWSERGRVQGERSIAAVAADVGAIAIHPFSDPSFLVTAARERGALGFRSRREALDILAGDLLPPGHSSRTSKASFNHSFFGPQSRALAAAWDGSGMDLTVVDPPALRQAWQQPRVDARSQWLLQVLRLRQLDVADGTGKHVQGGVRD